MGVVHDLRDLFHERRISGLRARCQRAMRDGPAYEAITAWNDLQRAISARSPEQVRRMERRMRDKAGEG